MASVVKHTRNNGATHHVSTYVGSDAAALLKSGKKLATKLYKDGQSKADWAEENVKEVSHNLTKKVKANPIASVLIAGGIGFILSALLRK